MNDSTTPPSTWARYGFIFAMLAALSLATAPRAQENPRNAAPAEGALTSLGANLSEGDTGLSLYRVRGGSPADTMKLKPGDRVTHINLRKIHSRSDASSAIRGLAPGSRPSAVVLRGLTVVPGTAEPAPLMKPLKRGAHDLSAFESVFQERRLQAMNKAADERIKDAPALDFRIRAKQSVWLRFPKGIPLEAAPGAVFEGVTTTGVSTDETLDYLSIPPGSALWGKLLPTEGPAGIRRIRLFFYKMRLKDGNYYTIAARATDISGNPSLRKVSHGGTIVLADRTALPPEVRVKVEFLKPIALSEPDSFFQAGPGLWLKTLKDGNFVISHVIRDRSADHAGLKVGQTVSRIEGKKSEKLDFPSAIGLLYGKPGSALKLDISDGEGENLRVERFTLTRGILYSDNAKLRVPMPYVKQRAALEKAAITAAPEMSEKTVSEAPPKKKEKRKIRRKIKRKTTKRPAQRDEAPKAVPSLK